MSDRSCSSDDSDGEAPDEVLASARRALSYVDEVVGADRTRHSVVADHDDDPTSADLSSAVDDLLRPPADSETSRPTGATSTSGESGATASSLIQRVKDRHRAPVGGAAPPPPPPPPPAPGPPEEEEYDFDEWELRDSPAALQPLAPPEGRSPPPPGRPPLAVGRRPGGSGQPASGPRVGVPGGRSPRLRRGPQQPASRRETSCDKSQAAMSCTATSRRAGGSAGRRSRRSGCGREAGRTPAPRRTAAGRRPSGSGSRREAGC